MLFGIPLAIFSSLGSFLMSFIAARAKSRVNRSLVGLEITTRKIPVLQLDGTPEVVPLIRPLISVPVKSINRAVSTVASVGLMFPVISYIVSLTAPAGKLDKMKTGALRSVSEAVVVIGRSRPTLVMSPVVLSSLRVASGARLPTGNLHVSGVIPVTETIADVASSMMLAFPTSSVLPLIV